MAVNHFLQKCVKKITIMVITQNANIFTNYSRFLLLILRLQPARRKFANIWSAVLSSMMRNSFRSHGFTILHFTSHYFSICVQARLQIANKRKSILVDEETSEREGEKIVYVYEMVKMSLNVFFLVANLLFYASRNCLRESSRECFPSLAFHSRLQRLDASWAFYQVLFCSFRCALA